MKKTIILKFDNFQLEAELFESNIANEFYDHLPYEIQLTQWGNEMYGSIGINLGKESPMPEIPEGGLAYTNQGNYFCIFYGQTPAWPVEYIGRITGDDYKDLFKPGINKVIISKKII